MDLSNLEEFVNDAELIALGTSFEDIPNVIAVANKYMEGNIIYLIDVYFNKTKSNMIHNPRVSLAVRNVHKGVGYQIHGISKKIDHDNMPTKLIELVQPLESFQIRGVEISSVFEITPKLGVAGKKLQ